MIQMTWPDDGMLDNQWVEVSTLLLLDVRGDPFCDFRWRFAAKAYFLTLASLGHAQQIFNAVVIVLTSVFYAATCCLRSPR